MYESSCRQGRRRAHAKLEQRREAIAWRHLRTSFDEFCVSHISPISTQGIATWPAFISRVLYTSLFDATLDEAFSSSIHQLSIEIYASHGQPGCALDYATTISSTPSYCAVCTSLRLSIQLPVIRFRSGDS